MSRALFYEVLINDNRQYDQWAQRVASGEWLGEEVFYQTPLYPYLLAVIYTPFGHSIWVARICQALFGALACVCLAQAGTRFFERRVGLAAGLMLALYPPAIFFDGILQKASLDLLLMTSLLWAMAVAQDLRRWPCYFVIGALLGATTLNRENAAALFPVLLLWIGWLSWPARPRTTLAWSAAFLSGAALVLLPVGARNYYVGGLFALTTSQMGTNFYIGNEANANGTYEALRDGRGDPRYESLDARLLAEQDLRRPLSPGEVSRYWMGRAWHDIRQSPGRWLRLLGWKWLLTWNRLEMVDSESMYTHAKHSSVLALLSPVWHLGVICPLAAIGIWWTRRDWRHLCSLYLVILAMAAAVTAFYVFARYRYPLVPPLMLFAAAGVMGGFDRLSGRAIATFRELAVAVILAAAVGYGCNISLAQAFNDDAVTYYNAANEFRDLGRRQEAIELWKLSVASDKRYLESYNNLGRALLADGNLAESRATFERGLAVQPRHARMLFGLATVHAQLKDETKADELLQLAMQADAAIVPALLSLAVKEREQGRPLAAVATLRAATRAHPTSAAAHKDLGMSLQALGRTGEAVEALRRAVALDPGMLNVANNLAWILATSPTESARNGAEAVKLAEATCKASDFKSAEFLDTLAASYAENGQLDKALAVSDQALSIVANGQLRDALTARKASYQAGRPHRDAPDANQ